MSNFSRAPSQFNSRTTRSCSRSRSPSRRSKSFSASFSPIPATAMPSSSRQRRDRVPRSRSRSRSPERHSRSDHDRHSRRRHHHHHRHGHGTRHEHIPKARPKKPEAPAVEVTLPFNAAPLSSKLDLPHYAPVLGVYLDIQKGIDIERLDTRELKGRWKSFVTKW